MYISLDLETSGLSPEKDKIIEIGVARFDNDKIIDKFQTFIKIDQPLAPIITHITGIVDDDLKDAPILQDVKEELIEFIGKDPIIGHNISFDIQFLNANGILLRNPVYDTLQLTGILVPGLPSYSLEMLTGHLDIKHTDKHRALDDAIATAELFQLMLKKIQEIGNDQLEEIKDVVSRSDWEFKEVFLNQKSNKETVVEPDLPDTDTNETKLNFDRDEILAMYDENGPISKNESDYEVREPQIKMTNQIIDAFENHNHLLCEAGTGTGKTIAYLLPAAFLASSSNTKVVVSTHTKTLQDQLFKKDVPIVQKAINHHLGKDDSKTPPFKACVLKGRKNYISVERLNQFKKKSSFRDHEITMLIKIILWLPHTQTGDKEEVSLQGKEFYVWNEVSCDHIKCPHNNHAYKSKCYLAKARERAQDSSIIITNHALLLNDTITPSQVLPEHKYLIIDEAHNLESEATKALTIDVTQQIMEGSLLNLRDLVKREPDLLIKIESLLGKIGIFFGLLGMFFEKNIHYANSIQHLALHPNFKTTLEWQKVEQAADNIYILGMKLAKELHQFTDDDIAEEDLNKNILQESETLIFHLRNLNISVLNTEEKPDEPYITWVFKKYDGSLGINSTMLHVGDHLQSTLLSEKNSVIMTSATLTTENNFDYFKKQLSLGDNFETCTIPSHFFYEDQAELVVYENLLAPSSHGFFDQSAEIIKQTAIQNKGRLLVLFTSKKAIQGTYLKLATPLKEQGITVLAQNVSGGRNKIIELFKQKPESSVIFGTNSFWEGIDIKGTALSCVIIQKLPFDPPDDPVHKARGGMHDNPFNQYQVPRAILRFKQGFGRLIRSAHDHGKVIILDSRIVNKSYGNAFIRSLPEGIRVNMVEY